MVIGQKMGLVNVEYIKKFPHSVGLGGPCRAQKKPPSTNTDKQPLWVPIINRVIDLWNELPEKMVISSKIFTFAIFFSLV